MTIRTEDIPVIDFSDIAEGEKLSPIHPGEILREEFLVPLKITPHALSLSLQVPATRINDIVRGHRAISVDTSLRLAKFFGTTAEFWMGLQVDYDMAVARDSMRETLKYIRKFEPAHS
jgi:addiction module HigA family antidote